MTSILRPAWRVVIVAITERLSVLTRIRVFGKRAILGRVPSLHRSVPVRVGAWVGLLALGLIAGRGPLLAPWLAAGLTCLLVATALAALVTADRPDPLWAPAALVGWPVLANPVAASLDDPAARLVAMSLAPMTVVFGAWWLTEMGVLRRPHALLTTVVATTAVVADVAFRDPYREQYCHPLCAPNPWVIAHRPGITDPMQWLVAATVAAVIVSCIRSIAATRPSFPRTVTILAIVTVAGLVGIASVRRRHQAPGSGLATSWVAIELFVLATAVAATLAPAVAGLLGRRRVARWIDVIEGADAAGGVVALLRQELDDPTVSIVDGAAHGATAAGRGTTAFSRSGRVVVTLEHRRESAERLRAMATSPVVAALENDALVDVAQRELSELRAARRAVVERSDDARRRLQRDLHDGAQQRLIVLGLELSTLAEGLSGPDRRRLDQAAADASAALTGLRRVAHGDLPPVLDEHGLAEALTSLAEESAVVIDLRVGSIAGRRFSTEVERAAYRFVTGSADLCALDGDDMTVTATVDARGEGTLVVATSTTGSTLSDRSADEDRVSAAGGSLGATVCNGRLHYEAVFRCE